MWNYGNKKKHVEEFIDDPTHPNYIENTELWRNPNDEFIGIVIAEISNEWHGMSFQDCLDQNYRNCNVKNIEEHGLLNFAEKYFEAKFDRYKINLFDGKLKDCLIKYIQNGKGGDFTKLKSKLINGFVSMVIESFDLLDIHVSHIQKNELQKLAIGESFISCFFDDYFETIEIDEFLRYVISNNEKILLKYRSLISVLAFEIDNLDKDLAFGMLSKEITSI